jgi:hypothetical protein
MLLSATKAQYETKLEHAYPASQIHTSNEPLRIETECGQEFSFDTNACHQPLHDLNMRTTVDAPSCNRIFKSGVQFKSITITLSYTKSTVGHHAARSHDFERYVNAVLLRQASLAKDEIRKLARNVSCDVAITLRS